MDIPLDAEVHCTDGYGGKSTNIIINPVTDQVTHLVVQSKQHPPIDHLVPFDYIKETTGQLIRLRCTKQELEALERFSQHKFVRLDHPDEQVENPNLAWPFAIPDASVTPLEIERVPAGELAISRGFLVEASDGYVGHLDEFMVDPAGGHVTHLVLREGHIWGTKYVSIPVSEIDRIEAETVYLKLDKRGIEALPAVPARRRWK